MDKYIGRLLDNRYEILEVIGTGGMAVVYKARCHRLNRLVAIKILKDDFSQDEEFRQRFHAESQAVAMLSHPNIVSIYDVSTSDDADYIVMELIDGISLKQYMEKKGVLNWKETLHFAIQIAKALDHAHSRGIVHRDIMPHNVMVLKNGSVKVADFGIARVMSQSNTLTKEALGSVHYISPEQAKGGNVDNRSDLYSLGVVMYEMMTGRPPYDGETPVSVAIQHINGKPQMPSTLNPNIPGGLEQIIMKVMDQDPDKRYPSAQAMLYDMDEFRKDPSILFDYNNSSTGMDDAIQIKSTATTGTTPQRPATPPERPVKRPGESAAQRAVRTAAKRPSGGNRPRRRTEEIIEEDERGGKAAKISIIVCSAVAAVAILVFLIALLAGNGLNESKNTVLVPNLLNQSLEDATQATDYVVEVEKWVYSSEYEKGKIIEQNPKAHTEINKGSTVTVVVSNGPEPKEKLMEDLLGLDADTAKNFLINTQGIPETNISILYEASETVAAGQIFKTEPAKDAPLTETTLIKLYVSTGPEVKTVTMVDFTSGGYTRESAEKWLELNGFMNVEVYEEVSDQPAGKIFFQNIPAGRTINVTTTIILRVSKGKNTTITLPPDALPEPDDYTYMVIPVALPTDRTEEYTVTIYREGVLMEERVIPVGTVSTEFRVSGKDTMKFSVLIDNEPYTTINVSFVDVDEMPYEQ
ncbi:MAG: Stk1 family PASTA domain-containing Ser/Thr kinase [Oscillospiraceae bacterium]|nr:Stk1 family PASTA domain-containing Ser/Thr kinase [Oscillospiraceae bacterium]